MKKYYDDYERPEEHCPSFIARGDNPTPEVLAILDAAYFAKVDKETQWFDSAHNFNYSADWKSPVLPYKNAKLARVLEFLRIPFQSFDDKTISVEAKDIRLAARRLENIYSIS